MEFLNKTKDKRPVVTCSPSTSHTHTHTRITELEEAVCVFSVRVIFISEARLPRSALATAHTVGVSVSPWSLSPWIFRDYLEAGIDCSAIVGSPLSAVT